MVVSEMESLRVMGVPIQVTRTTRVTGSIVPISAKRRHIASPDMFAL